MDLKSKHQSLAVIFMLLCSILASFGYAIYHFGFASDSGRVGSAPLLSQINVPTPRELHIMGQLKARLKDLAVPNESRLGPVLLEIFGYRRLEFNRTETSDALDESPEQLNYSLTFTFSSGSRRFCIIDGVFYPKGAILPDGAQIVRIKAHKVLIQKKEQKIWIPLELPANIADDQTISLESPQKRDVKG
jgi:hypothetical protein